MSRLDPQTAWQWIVENSKGKFSAKDRLRAFLEIARPSLSMLRRLLADPRTPRKLRLAAAERYAIAVARKELLRGKKPTGSDPE